MHNLSSGGLIVAGVATVGGLFYLVWRDIDRRDRLRGQVSVVHSGKIQSVRYEVEHEQKWQPNVYYGGYHRESLHYGSGHTTTMLKDVTIITMADGSSVIFEGKMDILYGTGTDVVVKQNGLGKRWIEKT